MSKKPFKLRSQSTVKNGGFKMMGSTTPLNLAINTSPVEKSEEEEETEEKERSTGNKVADTLMRGITGGLSAIYDGKTHGVKSDAKEPVKVSKEKEEVAATETPEAVKDVLSTVKSSAGDFKADLGENKPGDLLSEADRAKVDEHLAAGGQNYDDLVKKQGTLEHMSPEWQANQNIINAAHGSPKVYKDPQGNPY